MSLSSSITSEDEAEDSSEESYDSIDKDSVNQGFSKPKQSGNSAIVNFDDSNINQLIHQNRESGMFANIWSKIMLLGFTYNFITVWYFLGIVGFPSQWWLIAELLVELVMVFDFVIIHYLRHRMPNQWRTMWLLQAKEQSATWLHLFLSFTSSIP